MAIPKKFKFFIALLFPLLAGAIGGLFTAPAIPGWYAGLQKPVFSPPAWIFGPVWSVLYILMGIAFYLVWTRETAEEIGEPEIKKTKIRAIWLFFIQLVLNILWSIVFFGLKSPFWAFVEIIALCLAIAATTVYFRRISKKAARLFLPYFLWVSFAAVLNFAVCLLN